MTTVPLNLDIFPHNDQTGFAIALAPQRLFLSRPTPHTPLAEYQKAHETTLTRHAQRQLRLDLTLYRAPLRFLSGSARQNQ